MPKSISLSSPSLRIITFSGLTSRWRIADAVRVRRARRTTSTAIIAADLGEAQRRARSRNCFSVWPSMNSVTMYALAESSPE